MSENMSLLENLLSSAATLGSQYKSEQETFTLAAATRKARRDVAQGDVTTDERAAAGFDSPMFKGLSSVGRAFGSLFNDPTTAPARDAANAAARAFMAAFTGASAATMDGGTLGGYVAHIMLGNSADNVRRVLQARIRHWEAVADSAPEGESPKDAAARKAKAARYTVVCGMAPLADGSWAVNKKGEPQKPRHNGRPGATIGEIVIEPARGTDRKAQMAAFSRLAMAHGSAALDSAVVDAFLDNGGAFKGATMTVPQMAAAARDMCEKLLLSGGDASADKMRLMLTVSVLGRIEREGFASDTVAAEPAPATAADVVDSAPKDSEGEGEGESETAPPAPAEEKPKTGGRKRGSLAA